MTRHIILKYYAAAANCRVFFPNFQSTYSDPLDLSDHPLLLDIFSLGPPRFIHFFSSKFPLRNRRVRVNKVFKALFLHTEKLFIDGEYHSMAK